MRVRKKEVRKMKWEHLKVLLTENRQCGIVMMSSWLASVVSLT